MKKIFFTLAMLLAASFARAQEYDMVVAQDGSGDYTTIQAAVYAVKHWRTAGERTVIFIKDGIYREKLLIPSWTSTVTLLGESREGTVIINDDYSSKVVGAETINTYTSYTLKVRGNRTHLKNLTIENSAPQLGQAVALHIEADDVYVDNCNIIGNQDTLFANGEKDGALIENSRIEGTTDFIFGNMELFIDNCTIHCKKNSYITAASTVEGRAFGIAVFNSTITAAPEVDRMYLGRPWRNYAKTVFIDCTMGGFIRPEGWHNWGRPEAESLACYGEYNTRGVDTSQRVPWSKQLTKREASKYYRELERLKNSLYGNS